MEVFSIEYALLAMQSALLREITPELRAVIVDLDQDEQLLYIYFYFDKEVSETRINIWDCVIAEASTDLGPEFLLKAKIERLDYPQTIPSCGYCAYLRKEPSASHDKNNLFRRVKITEITMGYALLSVQQAMLGVVTPELRAVVVDFDAVKPLLYIRFYYDGEVPEKLLDLWQCAINEASTEFSPNCMLDGKVERADSPRSFPFRGRYAYFRKE